MNPKTCPDRQVLLHYNTGKLPEPDAKVVIAHVSSCPACQATLKTLGESADPLVARLPEPPAPPSPPAAVKKPAEEEEFDPYYQWLAIPPDEQPPNHYRLLGLRLFEENRDVIQVAAEGRTVHLKTRGLGKRSLLSQKLLNEVQQARLCLLIPEEKVAYDAGLREKLEAEAVQTPGSQATPPPAVPPPVATATRSVTGRPQWTAFFAKAKGVAHVVRSAVSAARSTHLPLMLIGAGAVAAAMCLGLVLYVATGEGTVKIELSDPTAKVEVKIDGKQIDIAGLKAPLSLSVGEHALEVTSGEFSTVTEKFSIRPGGEQVVSLKLVPKSGQPVDGPLPPGDGQGEGKPVVARGDAEPLRIPTGGPPPLAIAPFDATKAREHQEAWAKHLGVPVEFTNSIGMKFVLIPPGEFDMGATSEEIAWAIEEGKKADRPEWYFNQATEAPRHRVKISRPFYLGLYPVTQGEYEKVMGVNPSASAGKPMDVSGFDPPLSEEMKERRERCAEKVAGMDTSRHPVDMVSWDDAVEFCRRLSALPVETSSGCTYSLPTEAQWEYACRAGTTTRWSCGDDEVRLNDVAWYDWTSGGMSYPVGQKQPNAWGLYDMHGNLWQWCMDWYGQDYYADSPLEDPAGPSDGSARVLRGCPWGSIAASYRSASRVALHPALRLPDRTFRVVRGLDQPK